MKDTPTLFTHRFVGNSKRKVKKMTIFHKKFIVDDSKLNIGPTKSFRIIKDNFGGYESVGASKKDFRHFVRDLKTYIDGSDAQMFLDNFKMKKLFSSAFFYDFEVDDEECLTKDFLVGSHLYKKLCFVLGYVLTPLLRLIGIIRSLRLSLESIT